ncbi:unnamed protein product [Sphagnum jensenii]|uniref:Membrane-associated protein n=1 Tax=Sphagnum jensenii TaxID=128206 RepID=A0ABP1BWN7_9BRYO
MVLSVGKRIAPVGSSSLRYTAPSPVCTAILYWCAMITVSLSIVLLQQLRCTSASYLPPGEKHDSNIVIDVTKEYIQQAAALITTQTMAVQDHPDASNPTTKSEIDRKQDSTEKNSMKLAVQAQLLEAEDHGSPVVIIDHDSQQQRSGGRRLLHTNISVRKAAVVHDDQPSSNRHRTWRSRWRQYVNELLLLLQDHRSQQQQQEVLHHPVAAAAGGNEKGMTLQETITAAAAASMHRVLQFLWEVRWWNQMQLLTVRSTDHEIRTLVMSPDAAAAAVATHQLQMRLRRRQLRRWIARRKLIPAGTDQSKYYSAPAAAFPHTHSNDFFGDYKDPQNHPPRSN